MVSRRTLLFLPLVLLMMMVSMPAKAQDQFLGEIRYVAFNFAPQGWALCNGQTLPISQYTALFSLLGTQYGGDGVNTFNLPNMQGRVPVAAGNGSGLTPRVNGEFGGAESVALTIPQMPKHTHNLKAASGAANTKAPGGNLLANSSSTPIYSNQTADTMLRSSVVATTGDSQPHENMQPFLTMTCIIALVGIYPERQ